jgi:integrase
VKPAKNPATVYLSVWAEGTDSYTTNWRSLRAVAEALDGGDPEAFDWGSLRYSDVRALPAKLSRGEAGRVLKPPTVNKMLSALRGVLETAYRLGQLPEDEYRRIEVHNLRGKSLPAGRALTAEEMDDICRLLPATDRHDAAVMAMLAGAGPRRVELARLAKADYQPASGRVTLYGKGNKARAVPVGKRWRHAIELWWEVAPEGGKLFELPGKDPRQNVSYIVERFCKQHKLKKFTPHDLRRTFGTHVEKVAGIAMAQKLLGHESIQTTGLYVRVDEDRESAAVEDL